MFNPFNLFKKEKEHAQYGDKLGRELAQPKINEKTGEIELHIKGEKYPVRGFPRGFLLHGPLAPLKRYIKNLIVEELVKCLPYKIPESQWAEPVKELARVADLMIEAEDEPAMKKLIEQFKDAICIMLQEDDAWRFRFQWFLEHLDMKKMRLNKSDKYYFRAKSFKVDS